jgi:hypothetical protein
MRTNEESLAGITVIAVAGVQRPARPGTGPVVPPERARAGLRLAFTDKLAAVRQKQAGQVYVAGDTECVPAMTPG